MSNLSIEILVLTVLLVNFGVILTLTALLINLGAILTFNIYLRAIRELQRKQLFCGKSLSNPYCIIERFVPIINVT